jgi:hypothetical protein
VKCARRLPEKPFLLGSLIRMCGFLSGYAAGRPHAIDAEMVRFLRQEQLGRIFGSMYRPAERAACGITSGK